MFKEKFKELDDQFDELLLDEYIQFVNNFNYSGDLYSEQHHILPRCAFPNFAKESWNLVNLKYSDHIKAHILLAKSFPHRRDFSRPLNFLKEYFNEDDRLAYFNLKSIQSLNFWNSLTAEEYTELCLKMSIGTKEKMTLERKQEISEFFKKKWQDDEWRKIMIEKHRTAHWTEEGRQAQSERLKEKWKEDEYREMMVAKLKERYEDEEYYSTFCQTMSEVNNNLQKRLLSGEKIKEKWQDPEWRDKMLKRKPKSKKIIEVTTPQGEIFIFSGFSELIDKFNFNATLVRKSLKDNLPCTCKIKSINEKTQNTLGYIFKEIK